MAAAYGRNGSMRFWGGRLVIEMLAPGSVVPAFESLDAVHKKVLDGAHSASAY